MNDDDDDGGGSGGGNKECKTQFGFIMCEIYKKNNQINSYLISFYFHAIPLSLSPFVLLLFFISAS